MNDTPEAPQESSPEEIMSPDKSPEAEPRTLAKIPPAWPKIFLLLGIFLLVGIPSSIFLTSTMKKETVTTPTPTIPPTNTPTSSPTPLPKTGASPTSPSQKLTPSPSVSQTPGSPTSTQTPGRTPNPPQVSIVFPSDGQVIQYSVNNNSRNICVGYLPGGGDTTGAKFKYNINGSGWTPYKDLTSLCFDAQDGSNTIMLRYINSYNEESSIFTRTFTFENN